MDGTIAIFVESTSESALDATYKFFRSEPGRLLWTGRVGGSAVPQGRWKAVKQRLEFEERYLGRRDERGLEAEDDLSDSDRRDIQVPSGGSSEGPARAAAVSSKAPGAAGGSTQLPGRAPALAAPKPDAGSPKAPGPGGANRLRSGVSYAGAVTAVASPVPAVASGKSSGADLARSALLAAAPAPGSVLACPPISGETFRGSQANMLELLLPGMRPFLEAYARAHPQQRQVAAEVLASAPGIIAAKYGAGAAPQPPPLAKGAAAIPAVGAGPPKASSKAKGKGKAASSGGTPKGGGKGSAKAVASPKPAAPPKPAAAALAADAVAPAADTKVGDKRRKKKPSDGAAPAPKQARGDFAPLSALVAVDALGADARAVYDRTKATMTEHFTRMAGGQGPSPLPKIRLNWPLDAAAVSADTPGGGKFIRADALEELSRWFTDVGLPEQTVRSLCPAPP